MPFRSWDGDCQSIRRREGGDIGQVANVSWRRQEQTGGVDIRIEVEHRRPLAGRVWPAGHAPAPFAGWLELLAVLERLLDEKLETAPRRLGGELGPGREAELVQGARDVRADGAPGEVELLGDLGVGLSLGNEMGDP